MNPSHSRNNAFGTVAVIAGLLAGTGLLLSVGRAGAVKVQQHAARTQATDDLLTAVRETHATTDERGGALVADALRRGADPDAHYGNSPAIAAVTYRYIARRLPGGVPGGEDRSDETRDRWPVIFVATRQGDANVMRLLLAAGANVNARSQSGRTMLCNAVERQSVRTVKMLLDLGADPNEKEGIDADPGKIDEFGCLPLLMSVGSPEITRILLTGGADPHRIMCGRSVRVYAHEMLSNIMRDDQLHSEKISTQRRPRIKTLDIATQRSLALMDSAAKKT